MAGGIFIIDDQDQLTALTEAKYASEDLLQKLLEDYPDLMAGDQMDSSNPRRWLLIAREMGVPSEESGSNRWSLDHLFVDQDAVPTLVEVKRSTDTRIRREVVGQMMDYAANATRFWPAEALHDAFTRTCKARGLDPDETLAVFLEDENEGSGFWSKVHKNLTGGNLRLLFVADTIPDELRQIIEFMNLKMNDVEVLGVEIKQYAGEGLRTMVPRVVGMSQLVQQQKKAAQGQKPALTREQFLEALSEKADGDTSIASTLLNWAEDQGFGITYASSSFSVRPPSREGPFSLMSIWTSGDMTLNMGYLKDHEPFRDEESRIALIRRLNEVPGLQLDLDRHNKFPTIRLGDVAAQNGEQRLLAELQSVCDELNRAREL